MCELCVPERASPPLTRREFLLAGAAITAAAIVPVRPAGTQSLEIHPRSAWADDTRPPLPGLVAEGDVRVLLVHHSAADTDHRTENVPAILRRYYDFHTQDRGWPDIAYNFMIDRLGGVWEARAGSLAQAIAGDATGGNQGFTQLVCLIGDFTDAPPTNAALDSLVRTLARLADREGLDTMPGARASFVSRGSNLHEPGVEVTTPIITGHRAMSLTACPGDAFFPYVAGELTADVDTFRTSGGLPIRPVATAATSTPPTRPTTAVTSTQTTTSGPIRPAIPSTTSAVTSAAAGPPDTITRPVPAAPRTGRSTARLLATAAPIGLGAGAAVFSLYRRRRTGSADADTVSGDEGERS